MRRAGAHVLLLAVGVALAFASTASAANAQEGGPLSPPTGTTVPQPPEPADDFKTPTVPPDPPTTPTAFVTVGSIGTLAIGSGVWAARAGERAKDGEVVSTAWGPSALTSLRVLALGLDDGTELVAEQSEDRYRLLKIDDRYDGNEVVLYDLREQKPLRYELERVSMLAWLATDGMPQVVGNPCITDPNVLRPALADAERQELCSRMRSGRTGG